MLVYFVKVALRHCVTALTYRLHCFLHGWKPLMGFKIIWISCGEKHWCCPSGAQSWSWRCLEAYPQTEAVPKGWLTCRRAGNSFLNFSMPVPSHSSLPRNTDVLHASWRLFMRWLKCWAINFFTVNNWRKYKADVETPYKRMAGLLKFPFILCSWFPSFAPATGCVINYKFIFLIMTGSSSCMEVWLVVVCSLKTTSSLHITFHLKTKIKVIGNVLANKKSKLKLEKWGFPFTSARAQVQSIFSSLEDLPCKTNVIVSMWLISNHHPQKLFKQSI